MPGPRRYIVHRRARVRKTDELNGSLVYTIAEAAEMLKVCRRTIHNLLRSGELVRRKIGTRTVIPRISIECFVRRDHSTGNKKVTAPQGQSAVRNTRLSEI